ncbi:hypothetical protein GCM10007391_30590 [Alteromonas halophila]|uniref:Uncharacterized protein n=1 Tax=Alteromonas halophila TaxID=516698 RepID=A0A918N0N3_9ALTE|nr:hypothetical protein GCM10007391_30590 [Alteromonas halophila]
MAKVEGAFTLTLLALTQLAGVMLIQQPLFAKLAFHVFWETKIAGQSDTPLQSFAHNEALETSKELSTINEL